ncbi:MAG: 5'/3'-nucleotidase SurE [Bacteroidales bacterium]|nr:5'/3'-nucleotidase SurE [Bacteroidales bacterium]
MDDTKPLILVTNDDGKDAKGLQALIEVVRPLGLVYAVVPETSQSGMSHAISVRKPIQVQYRKEVSADHYHCYTVSGTPVDCIKLALNKLLPRRPDLVVSGINHGSNASVNLIYSGTMGAAVEGAINRIRSIGFSLLDFDQDADFTTAALISKKLILQVLANGYHPDLCLNVNIPAIDPKEIKGLRVCRQTRGYWVEEFEESTDDQGNRVFLLTGSYTNLEPGHPETDEWALENGYAAVVPVEVDHTRYEDVDTLRDLNFDLNK